MVNKPRNQGTKLETAVVKVASAFGLLSRRLAEGGERDEGDVDVYDADGNRWIIECKSRAALNAHGALQKARGKAFTNSDADYAAVVWKRLARKKGNVRRSAVGEPAVVLLTVNDFFGLLGRAGGDHRRETAGTTAYRTTGGSLSVVETVEQLDGGAVTGEGAAPPARTDT